MSSVADVSTASRKHRRRGPFSVHIDGLYVSYRSANRPNHNLGGQLVSHSFVDLLREIQADKFSQPLFEMLSERERNFMSVLLRKVGLESHAFESARNAISQSLINRLNMLTGASEIGNDNPSIQTEIAQLIERLYQSGTFSQQMMLHLRRSFARKLPAEGQ